MLPPPPLPPMARPVAIIRSTGDLTMVNSPPSSITPPIGASMSSPSSSGGQQQQDQHGVDPNMSDQHQQQADMNGSPPLSPQSQIDDSRKSLARIPSPYSTGREYTFNHYHTQPQVKHILLLIFKNYFFIHNFLYK